MKAHNGNHITRARRLRRDATPWERKLWNRFLRGYPIRWRRQAPLGGRIVDFYCAKAGLTVELDGGGHYAPEQRAADLARTREIATLGHQELRFTNIEVDRHFPEVCAVIDRTVRMRMRERGLAMPEAPPQSR